MQKLFILFAWVFLISQIGNAADSNNNRGKLLLSSDNGERIVVLFKEISRLTGSASPTAAATECGYIFPGDPNKFGCKGTGKAASDVAAACSGGGSLACTGSGTGRTCTCAFN